MKKVIVRLGNGLGNQLFTYAAAYCFAKKNNADLYVDDESGFYKRYKYELHNFKISASIVDKKHKFIGIQGRIKRKILIKLNNLKKNKIFLIETRDFNKLTSFNNDQFNLNFNNKLYFEGYFQSEKYFIEEKNNIRNEFSFQKEIVDQKNSFIENIKKTNSISIHIRQDKYLADEGHKNIEKLNKEHFKLNVENTKKGIDYFDKKFNNPSYFIWSNNFSGLRDLFPSNKFIFVDENLKKDPAYDLHMMSLCKHFILSPSTMHYWGAYLSKNNEKICIAPRNIINNSGYYGFSNNKDIKPEWWKEV